MTSGLRAFLPTTDELRAMTLTFRGPSSRRDSPGRDGQPSSAADEALLALAGDPFESVDEVRRTLTEVEARLRDHADRRSVFLTVYAEMTAHVDAGIESGAFDDPDWVRRYLVAFANRYREALVDYAAGRHAAVPEPWTIGFRAATNDATLLIQDALLGINAHINYDLPYTLRDVSIDPNRRSKRRDHDRINTILRRLVDIVQRALADSYHADGYRQVDEVLGSFDEAVTLVGLTEARSLAWRNAVLLTDSQHGLVHRFVAWRVRTVSIGASHGILSPTLDRSMLELLRQLETGGPPLDRLLDTFQQRSRAADIDVQ